MCTYLVIFLNNFLETYENDALKLLPNKCVSANDDFKMGVVSLLWASKAFSNMYLLISNLSRFIHKLNNAV